MSIKVIITQPPLWLYRVSNYSTSNLGGFEDYNKTILQEYKKLWKEKMQ